MGGYLASFIIYTAAMIGVIFIAVLAYKKFSFSGVSKSKFLSVEDCINLSPRKNLYVIKAGNEKFLVASDVERTTLISKLGDNQSVKTDVSMTDDLPAIVDFPSKMTNRTSNKIFKNIINNI